MYDRINQHIVEVEILPEGGIIYHVRDNFCYDCSLKYSRNKPSFWADN
jgi:hypothetical protein